jgi:hypothetical protein
VKKATIKPEFAEYVKRYGYPPGGAFDPDKLGKIKNELNLTRTTQQQQQKPKTPQSELNAFIQRSIALKSHKQK